MSMKELNAKELGMKKLNMKELNTKELGMKKPNMKELNTKELGMKKLSIKGLQAQDLSSRGKPILRAVNVSKSYPDGTGKSFYAVREVSLSIIEHTLTIIKGRSGSGKTTLINLMSTLEEPDGGEIYYDFGEAMPQQDGEMAGSDSTDNVDNTGNTVCGSAYSSMDTGKKESLRRLKMGFVFQSIALIPVFTAYENVEFPLRMAGIKKRRQRVEALLETVGLKDRMYHMPDKLSGGEQQRVAIARAVAHHPTVLFADEPTGALDTDTGLQVMDFFQRLIREEELTVVMTTHDPRLMAMGDMLYEMSDGNCSACNCALAAQLAASNIEKSGICPFVGDKL